MLARVQITDTWAHLLDDPRALMSDYAGQREMTGAIDYPSISAADAARSEPDEDFPGSGRVKFNDLPGKICSAVGDCGHYQHCGFPPRGYHRLFSRSGPTQSLSSCHMPNCRLIANSDRIAHRVTVRAFVVSPLTQ